MLQIGQNINLNLNTKCMPKRNKFLKFYKQKKEENQQIYFKWNIKIEKQTTTKHSWNPSRISLI